ncbi:haloacid dehalogenase-like hydrolase [Chitinimonas arctica]|uniref:phosphoserine phosphatase n=1 Tax=Chitinimonas arctica TaxID=2594795 RepID=A0A516SK08_9NEIS|nr:haloacid dehalogenase-like hydrolase [Chitinimonas arctica]QDQ28490.1 haloacid dehalogenase-like hydrolase [Chitinimonas arctica]
MQRRTLLKVMGAGTVMAAPIVAEAAKPGAGKTAQQLDPARWSAFNRDTVNQLLQAVGKHSPRYNPKKKPYAVFDWDNTCIMNDCEEALMIYQINHLAYKMTPAEFAQVVRQDVPNGPYGKDYLTVDGKTVKQEDIAADVEEDYRWLHANFQGLAGSMSLEQIQQTEQFKDFRAKMFFMYDAICDSHPIEIGYKWIIYFYKNFSRAELQAMAEASNDYSLGDALRKIKLTSSEQLPGKAGVVAINHSSGIRIHEEMLNLMTTLRANGIDVYVSTASIDDVVRVFAGNTKYGYHVPPENVIGLQLEIKDGKYDNVYKKGYHFNWGPGKTTGIQNVLVKAKGYGPLLVAGDSDGDAWMMRDFADTKLGVIVNRLKKGEIGANSQKAAATIGQAHARFILQGRNEHTGLFLPDEKTLKYGKTEAKLLA